jgi:putative PIN family toxin of toxin-antitoxin system
VTRAVVDTHVLVSGVIAPHGAPRRILEAWHADQFTLVTSEPIVAEVARVLRDPRIRDRYSLTEDDVATVVDSLRTDKVVAGLYEVQRSVDPADDMFLACALEGLAEYVVSGDRHVLEIGSYHDVLIVTPRHFAALLAAENGSVLP